MLAIGVLILSPLIAGCILLCCRGDISRNVIVALSSVVIALASIYVFVSGITSGPQFFTFESQIVDVVCTIVGALLSIIVLAFSIKYKNIWAFLLACIQLVGSLFFDLVMASGISVPQSLYFDNLTLVMVLIIGIVGCSICVYACGYMEDFQAIHANEKDRRPIFFAIMYVFLSGMYLLVFSNNMSWMFTGWEITTVCSFLLISYTRTQEAIHNAFRQIIMNMAGGIAFLAAMMYVVVNIHTLNFDAFLHTGVLDPALVLFPVVCFSFAGITKAAQMPFHTWLLGAMVAPTPTSALLHSSTMVKAGVFMLIKMAPLYAVSPVPSLMLILIGGITFCLASFIAISQSNAKRVLAYSTVANLGLIVALAGVGTAEAIWAAIFLIVFHAVAKSLMFLCVGTAEHHIGSRNIEEMDQLFQRMPKLSRAMMIGAMIMFIAPFGMLVAKWATLVTLIDSQQYALIFLMLFGSAATFAFWAKWLGKLAGVSGEPENIEGTVHKSERFAIGLMLVIALVLSATIPLSSAFVVEPYLVYVFGASHVALGPDMLVCASILTVAVAIVMLTGMHGNKQTRHIDAYFSGVAKNADLRTYVGAKGQVYAATQRNFYLDNWFGEARITPIADISTICVIVICFAIAIGHIFGLV